MFELYCNKDWQQLNWTGKTFRIFAIHNWILTETNGKTKIDVDESMEGFFAKLLKKSFNKTLENGLQNRLDLLKQECEK